MESAPSRRQQTHDRIVDTAARALRGTGFGGIGVADIMKQAGLTHGGFYAHFASRDALLAEALQRAGEDSQERVRRSIAAGAAKGMSPFRALVEGYLSERHLKSPESGCPVAALASEMPRQTPEVREVAARRVQALFAAVAATLPPDAPAEVPGLVASHLVGALQLARALGDNAQGRRHLATARRFLVERYEPAAPAGR